MKNHYIIPLFSITQNTPILIRKLKNAEVIDGELPLFNHVDMALGRLVGNVHQMILNTENSFS